MAVASIQSVQCNAASCSPDVTAHFKEGGWLDAMRCMVGWDGMEGWREGGKVDSEGE